MKRFRPLTIALGAASALALYVLPAGAAGAAVSPALFHGSTQPLCQSHVSLCRDSYDDVEGQYVGHDEPAVAFRSGVRGSGNDITYVVTLPTEPAQFPSNDGPAGATWNFQLRPTFWFGLTLCDTESAPEFTKKCKPDSDANNLVGDNPAAPDYIGKHPGNAFMELQFYGPGYVPQFEGFGCTATQYCAAMTIDSLTVDQNTGIENTPACDNFILGGGEPINWAYITRNGRSQAPANPLFTGTFDDPNLTAVNPDPAQDLMMNPGDRIRIHIHDTRHGVQTDLFDLTTHQRGSMTASIRNGFGHILYQPNSPTCNMEPYEFHPEYSTANPRGNTWSAHTTNVSMSDEIGHFENCKVVDPASFNCSVPGDQEVDGTLDEDDANGFCVPGEDSTLVKINGCFSADEDYDGQSYLPDWPGTLPDPVADQALHPSPLRFTSPLANGKTNYSTIQFETDLPRIEADDSQDNPPFCDRITGDNCVNPPAGAKFYPFFTTGRHDGGCAWQEGGNFIPGTIEHFGGSSTTEFGPLLSVLYPDDGFTPIHRINDFNSGDLRNPCPANRRGGDD